MTKPNTTYTIDKDCLIDLNKTTALSDIIDNKPTILMLNDAAVETYVNDTDVVQNALYSTYASTIHTDPNRNMLDADSNSAHSVEKISTNIIATNVMVLLYITDALVYTANVYTNKTVCNIAWNFAHCADVSKPVCICPTCI